MSPLGQTHSINPCATASLFWQLHLPIPPAGLLKENWGSKLKPWVSAVERRSSWCWHESERTTASLLVSHTYCKRHLGSRLTKQWFMRLSAIDDAFSPWYSSLLWRYLSALCVAKVWLSPRYSLTMWKLGILPCDLELFSLSTGNMIEYFEGLREGRTNLGDRSFFSEEIAGLEGSCLHTMELGSLLRR